MRITRHIAAAFATSVAALAVGGVASAAPNGDTIDLICDGLPNGSIVVAPNEATWTPGHLVTERGLLMPYRIEYVGTFYPVDGEPVVTERGVDERRRPQTSHATGSCTASLSFPIDEPGFVGTFVYELHVEAFWTAG